MRPVFIFVNCNIYLLMFFRKGKSTTTEKHGSLQKQEVRQSCFFGSANIRHGKAEKSLCWLELILGYAIRTGQPAGPKTGLRHAMTNK